MIWKMLVNISTILSASHCRKDPSIHSIHSDTAIYAEDSAKAYWLEPTYRLISNITRTKSQKSNGIRLVLQLSMLNLLKPEVKSKMKM